MALIACQECKAEISSLATACPKCGAPQQKLLGNSQPDTPTWAKVTMGIIGFGVFLYAVGSFSDAESGSKTRSNPNQCATNDLGCRGNAGTVAAGVYCAPAIERMAKHSVRWTDGTFEPKISRFRWTVDPAGLITYIGDKAEFQNGFGAYTPVIYECDLGSDNKTVLDVRIIEGRLP